MTMLSIEIVVWASFCWLGFGAIQWALMSASHKRRITRLQHKWTRLDGESRKLLAQCRRQIAALREEVTVAKRALIERPRTMSEVARSPAQESGLPEDCEAFAIDAWMATLLAHCDTVPDVHARGPSVDAETARQLNHGFAATSILPSARPGFADTTFLPNR